MGQFDYKPDATVIQAFEQAQQQRLQEEQNNLQKKRQDFQMVKETTEAVSGMVSSMVAAAQARNKKNLVNEAKEILAKPEPTATIVDPMSGDAQNMVPNPAVADRKKALLDISGALAPESLGSQAAAAAFPNSASTQSKRFQQGTAEVDGRPLLITFDTQTGDYLDNEKNSLKGKQIRGFKPTITTDPNTQGLVSVGAAGEARPIESTATTKEIIAPLELNVRQSNRLKELQKEFQDDDLVKSNRMNLNTLNNLKTVQAEGTGALIGSLQSLRARGIAGEKGVLTEQDVLRTTGSPALARRFANAFTKLALGEENEQNIREFNSAIASVEKAAINRNKKVEQEFIKNARSTKELSNVAEDLIRANITKGTEAFESAAPSVPDNKKSLQDAINRIKELKNKAAQ